MGCVSSRNYKMMYRCNHVLASIIRLYIDEAM